MLQRLRRYEFSERLAEILGESRRDLRFRVTLMITDGLVPPGPRGPGSPPATPDYAADLLIGVMAAPQQSHTVDAIRCYRELRPTVLASEAGGPGVVTGPPRRRHLVDHPELPLLAGRPPFGEVLARLLEQASGADTPGALARELFGIWLSRGFPVAAVQLAAWSEGRRAILTQRYELPEGGRPPAWLDPDRGGAADPGLFHSVFLPVGKLIEIGALTTPPTERKPLVLGQTIASLANLARHRGNRRPWEKFLSKAAEAEAIAEGIDARGRRLLEVTGFGGNPGNLRMLTYVPETLLEPRALVVVLHGCTQTATSYEPAPAGRRSPTVTASPCCCRSRTASNNPLRCFNWFKVEDTSRDGGEALSIREMVERMVAEHGIDRRRVYRHRTVGRWSDDLGDAGDLPRRLCRWRDHRRRALSLRQRPAGCVRRDLPGAQPRRARVGRPGTRRLAAPGAMAEGCRLARRGDSTVKPINADEIVKQWADVHVIDAAASVEDTVDGYPRRVWRGTDGRNLIESYSITGMAHGAPIAPGAADGFGQAGPFINDVGISSTQHIARFWGLTEKRVEAPAASRRPAAASAAPPAKTRTATKEPTPAPGMVPSEAGNAIILVDGAGRARAGESRSERRSDQHSQRQRRSDERADRSGAGARPGVDVQAILAKSFELAGIAAGTAGGLGKGGGGGVDVQAILAKSFELAGLVAKPREATSEPPTAGSPARAEPPTIDGEATAAPEASEASEPPGAAEPSKPEPQARAADTPGHAGSLAGSGWEADGWEFVPGHASAPGPSLYGYASSGVGGDVGNKIRSAWRRMSLGQRPMLSYVRKLELNAAANILTSASFTVLVDGVPVDEVSAIGMDYAEAEWTERGDIDLAPFAGRTVTLSFEVAANSNVCIEVFAKAWLRGVTVRDAVVAPAC